MCETLKLWIAYDIRKVHLNRGSKLLAMFSPKA